MNQTIFLTTAAVLATAAIQPLQAKPHDGDGRGGGGKGKAAQSAPARQMPQAAAPRAQVHAQVAPKQKQFVQHSQHMQNLRGNSIAGKSGKTGTSGLANNRNFRSPNRQRTTVALGGSTTWKNQQHNERNTFVQQNNNRYYGGNRYSYNRFNYRPPTTVFRDWDRRSIHVWNNHRYRWYNNDWVIIDAGVAPYYYDYDYGYAPAPVASGNTAMAVQEELSRAGYDPGAIDGVIGPQTRNAIAAYQEDHGLPVTGRMDRPLLREMGL